MFVGPPTLGQGASSPFLCETSAVLDVVQDASRRLRRCRTASWTTSVRGALPTGRSGRRNGRQRSNKGIRLRTCGHLNGLVIGVIRRLPFERRAQGIEQTIADSAQGTCVAVAASSQGIV